MKNYLNRIRNYQSKKIAVELTNSNEGRLTGRLRRGITLVELAIVMIVLGIIMTMVFSNVDFSVSDKAVALQVKTNATVLTTKLEMYSDQLSDGQSLEILTQPNSEDLGWSPLKEDAVKDPWGRFYFIRYDENERRQICTYGKDGEPGGVEKASDFCITDKSSYPQWLRGK